MPRRGCAGASPLPRSGSPRRPGSTTRTSTSPATSARSRLAVGRWTSRRLRALMANEMEQRLDRAHPLWSLHVVEELDDGRAALLLKVHHALADGSEVMRLGATLLWDEEPATASGGEWRPEPVPGTLGLVAAALRERAGGLAGGAATAAREAASPRAWRAAAGEARRLPGAVVRDLLPTRGPSPLDAPTGGRRDVAFASTSLETLKRVEHAQSERTTVNDVLLALVTGALRRWISHHGGEPHEIHVKIPVSLHDRHAHPDALANRDSFLCVGLPLGEPDPMARVRAVAVETRERKQEHDAQTLDALFRDMRHMPRPISRLAARLTGGPRVFALNVSNVPGPAGPRRVLGAPVTGHVVAGRDRRAPRPAHRRGLARRDALPRAHGRRGGGRGPRRDRRRARGRGGRAGARRRRSLSATAARRRSAAGRGRG